MNDTEKTPIEELAEKIKELELRIEYLEHREEQRDSNDYY